MTTTQTTTRHMSHLQTNNTWADDSHRKRSIPFCGKTELTYKSTSMKMTSLQGIVYSFKMILTHEVKSHAMY